MAVKSSRDEPTVLPATAKGALDRSYDFGDA